MPSETDLINYAARLVGASAITSRSDGSDTANVADDIFDDLRNSILRANPWNFATKRAKLAQSSTTPTFEFDYAYVLPSDWLRTISVSPDSGGRGQIIWRMEQVNGQRVILAESVQLYLRYVAKVTDPNLWSSDFIEAFINGLARDFAIPLASSNTLFQLYRDRAKASLAQARSADAMGSFPEIRPRGSWADSRGGFRQDPVGE